MSHEQFEKTLEGETRARITALFDGGRPWQILNLMSRHWQEILNAGPALFSERMEAQFMAAQFRWMAAELRALDDAETAEHDDLEIAGAFDSINELLAEEAKTYTPKPRTFPHRYSPDDSRCVYCGGMGVTSHLPGEDCEVLRQAYSSLHKVG